jgi:asparagine synthase (glutamine-hydrolysing)
MSGFVGILNLDGGPVDGRVLYAMTRFLAFRGPDAQRTQIIKNVGLGHARLDMTEGLKEHTEEPFTIDGRHWIVADARVDAREELIAALESRGESGLDRHTGDIELILRAYQVWDEDCVTHLLGDFAFAIWDEPRRQLFCARDHLGVKPFYYATVDRQVIFSNSLDCVRLHPAVSRTLNDAAIADFLLCGVNGDIETTSFHDIRRLPAAHSITWSRTTGRCRRYWTLPIEEPIYFKRAEEYTLRFTELLKTALSDRLRTRRVAVLMSGGVDSSTLAAIALPIARERSSDHGLVAMTSVYDRLIPDTERHFASLVARHLKIPITFDVRDDEPSIANWDELSVHTPEPVDNPAAHAAAVTFARKAASQARVFLYGEGPDNALAYEWRPYLSHLFARRRLTVLWRAVSQDLLLHRRIPFWSSIRQAVHDRAQNHPWREEFPNWLNEDFAARYRCRERWAVRRRPPLSPHPIRPASYLGFTDIRWQALFEDCDITGALSHTETRYPFLDLRVLRYLLALPAMPWCRNKLIIRRSMKTSLPAAVLARKKTAIPMDPNFQRVLVSGLPRLVPNPDLLKYVNPGKILSTPRSPLELRVALRPHGLNYWLDDLACQ